jgi:hypothetical protein
VTLPRLRQAVVVTSDLGAVRTELERCLDVRSPLPDPPGVGHFGLTNAVYAVGDTFVEAISPTRPDTAAGRQLERLGGDGGYMCMFELADETAVRRRIGELGVRIVHDSTHEDIVDVHLHPKDVPGAIVALDVTDPEGSWRWGGPDWAADDADPGIGLRGLTVAVRDAAGAAELWAALLGVPTDGARLRLDGGRQTIEFVPTTGVERITAVDIAVGGHTGEHTGDVEVAGVVFRRTAKARVDA